TRDKAGPKTGAPFPLSDPAPTFEASPRARSRKLGQSAGFGHFRRAMTLATLPTTSSLDVTGGVKLVSSSDLLDHLAEADREGLLSVLVPPPGPGERGQLAVVIEEAIESCLIRRGACGPGIGAAADLDGSLSDQLYRDRKSVV